MPHETSHTNARVALLTVSDTRTLEEDVSGSLAISELQTAGHSVVKREIVRDVPVEIATLVSAWSSDQFVDAIIVTGGTGPARRDITPDTIVPLLASVLPGFGELFRQLSYEEIGASAMLSRAVAGWIDNGTKRTPIFLLPGSPKAVTLAVSKLIAPQLGHLLEVSTLEVVE
ncbi:MAG: MogA/MoaB family molybdenum cofactor biosynthesis protein [Phycisphaerae bacterium]|jgi:molybdopterin adenylyltransferase|nr:MogA/MoaB family molybdenum cofactor biosynthesis protein [Phycisphaerae bacterium]